MSGNKNTKTLHFSLGPVQSFIGQARRTRDLWAGSFLLSWLSGQAMAKLIEQNGKMNFPKVKNDPLFNAIKGTPLSKEPTPKIATLPNRFQAKVSDKFDANQLTKQINKKWQELSDAVYEQFVAYHAKRGNKTKEIWDRQINNFWEVQWVIGDDAGDLLDKRKNWRSQRLSVEGGKHCTTMGDYQELSGHLNSKKQEKFWQKIRKGVSADKLNLRPNERLCAISLVKRLFVYLHEDELIKIIGWVPDDEKRKLANFPSTSFMAAVPWLSSLKNKNENVLIEYAAFIKSKVKGSIFNKLSSEYPTKLNCLTVDGKNNKPWQNLDGNLYNQTALMNWRSTVLSNSDKYFKKSHRIDPDEKEREEIAKKLNKLTKDTKAAKASSNFYALLLMDGDSLGKLLRDNKPALVSEHLSRFAAGVKDIVDEYCGVTIYAGGDDVLALVPLHKVICCAKRLNHSYEQAFCGSGVDGKTTLSGAIIFSHFHNPFTEVLQQAHHQLDNIAKDKNDRDSLAIAVMKPGNVSCQWVNKWNHYQLDVLNIVANRLHSNELSHGFYYKITERYKDILEQEYKDNITLFEAILKAELKKTKEKKITDEQIDVMVDEIKLICAPNKIKKDLPQMSGLYLSRFLATEDKSKGNPS